MTMSKQRVKLEKMLLDSGKTWRDVAKELGISHEYLSKLINQKTSKSAQEKWLSKIESKLN